jgi:hypothetical protein
VPNVPKPFPTPADEITAQTDPEEVSALRDAKNWLKQTLANGPVPSKDIQNQAKALRISTATLRRAQKALKVRARKQEGPKGPWYWEFKDAQGDQYAHVRDRETQNGFAEEEI